MTNVICTRALSCAAGKSVLCASKPDARNEASDMAACGWLHRRRGYDVDGLRCVAYDVDGSWAETDDPRRGRGVNATRPAEIAYLIGSTCGLVDHTGRRES